MQIENGDYFVIERGEVINEKLFSKTEEGELKVGVLKEYDHFYKGLVFKAVAVEDHIVLAEVIFQDERSSLLSVGRKRVGQRSLFNANNVKMMTLSKGFISVLKKEENHQNS